jgi:hypothetical protein
MAGSHQRIAITCLHLVALFIPILGQSLATIELIGDDLSPLSRVLWLVIIWLFPFLGPLLYEFFRQQRRNKMRSFAKDFFHAWPRDKSRGQA